MGRLEDFASANASGPQVHQSTGLSLCWSRYGDVASLRRFTCAFPSSRSRNLARIRIDRNHLARDGLRCLRDAPDRIADIIGDKQRSILRNCYAYRAAEGFLVLADKTGEDINRDTRRLSIGESNEHDLVDA